MKLPKEISKKEKQFLKEVYEKSLAKDKNKDPKKAKATARAMFYEEAFKIFLRKQRNIDILMEWKKRKDYRKKILNEDALDYKKYKVNGKEFIVSTDKKILKKFNSERSGILRDMKDEYETEILFQAKRNYGIKLHPDMYYVIK